MNCKEKIRLEFCVNILGGMATAENLKSKNTLKDYSLRTIKKNLSQLKNDKVLNIGFRTNGCKAVGGYRKGKCYYKLA